MFTGIIETTGVVENRTFRGDDCILTLASTAFDFSNCALGDSIAVNGVCLTATDLGADYFCADVSVETLNLTTLGDLTLGAAVNLERALTLQTPLGGHLVSGHVDGIGVLISREPDARSERLTFQNPPELSRYIARKGSITIDGISLTVNSCDNDTFSVNIVPHTMSRTTLGQKIIGDRVNLEVDLIARYLERLLQSGASCDLSSGVGSGLTVEKLQQFDF